MPPLCSSTQRTMAGPSGPLETQEEEDRTDFSRNARAVLSAIEAEATAGVRQCDPRQLLADTDFGEILAEVVDKVFGVMEDEGRTDLNDRDRGFIKERTRILTRAGLPRIERPRRRFAQLDRVVCKVGGERRWAPGTVQAVDEDDPKDPTGQTLLPYVVRIDPPNSRLVSVSEDSAELVRVEVCFGQHAEANWFTVMCLPMQRRQRARPRFAQGERVACAVEDATKEYSDWAGGTVAAVGHAFDFEGELAPGSATVAYKVQLDNGSTVLVHRDEHRLVRELALQPEGARLAADGTRCLTKFAKRPAGDGWAMVDHSTRMVRRLPPGRENNDDDDDDDDEN